MKNNIVIITGGTGGHVLPALNFFKYIDEQSENVYLLTDGRGKKYIKGLDNNKLLQITSSHLAGNIYFKFFAIIKLLTGLIQSFFIFIRLRPKIIITFGSYASLTPLICYIFFKYIFKTKLYIHEQNSIVGQTNKFFSKYANKIFVNFNKEYPSIKKFKSKISVVGLPQDATRKSLKKLDKKNDLSFNFLVFAGSQGSLDIIIIFTKIFAELKKIPNFKKIKFIIQCPTEKQQVIKNLLFESDCDFEIKNFFDNFETILIKTDIALCRSGAGTINDLIEFNIPAIICPLSSAKDNHQFENAKILSDIECGIIINKNNIKIEKIFNFINKIINDKKFNKSLIDNYSKINIKNSNKMMWKLIKNEQKK